MISKADRELVRRYLGRVSLFREVSEKQRAQLVDEFSTLKASRNEVILTQDESSSDLYLILQGRVKVTLMNEDGAEYVVTDLRAGDCFGEMSTIWAWWSPPVPPRRSLSAPLSEKHPMGPMQWTWWNATPRAPSKGTCRRSSL